MLLDAGFTSESASRTYAALARNVLGFAAQLCAHDAVEIAPARLVALCSGLDPADHLATIAVADHLPNQTLGRGSKVQARAGQLVDTAHRDPAGSVGPLLPADQMPPPEAEVPISVTMLPQDVADQDYFGYAVAVKFGGRRTRRRFAPSGGSAMMPVVRAGLITLATVAALLATACSSVPNPVTHRTHITADFLNIAGVFQGNPITVLGLQVGTVDKIVPHDEYVEVHMTVDGDVQIPANVTAALISPSIVTDRHIELTPRYTGGATLADDAHLTVNSTRTPVELDTLIKTIDQFVSVLKPESSSSQGPLSATLLYDMVNGKGAQIRDTLTALSGALKTGVDNGDAISSIVVKLNELTSMLADNDQSVRDFSDRMTQLSSLLAQQAPGLQATLDQMNSFLSNTSTTLGQYQDQLASSLSGLKTVTDQLRANAAGLTEVADVTPLILQNLDRTMDRQGRFFRAHLVPGVSVDTEVVSLFCQRIQMRADGCNNGKIEDLGPDFGLTAALLGLTK